MSAPADRACPHPWHDHPEPAAAEEPTAERAVGIVTLACAFGLGVLLLTLWPALGLLWEWMGR